MATAETNGAISTPSRSPSPAIAPPIPAAPGPRATALQKLYTDAVAHVLKTCNYANFSACFPTPAREASDNLKSLHEQFSDKLGEHMHRTFDTLMENRNVYSSLNELDNLIEDARRRKRTSGGEAPLPPHTLPAQQLYLSHLAPSLTQYSQSLKERQEAVQDENAEILSRVMAQRKQIQGLVDGFETVIADLEASVVSLHDGDADSEGLRDERRDVDEGMRMDV